MIGVALLSGGLDSGVAAACFAEQPGCELRAALFCDYGQRAVAKELCAAQRLAARLDVALHRYELPWLASLAQRSGAAIVDRDAALPEASVGAPGDEQSARAVWVPARNAVFVASSRVKTFGATSRQTTRMMENASPVSAPHVASARDRRTSAVIFPRPWSREPKTTAAVAYPSHAYAHSIHRFATM